MAYRHAEYAGPATVPVPDQRAAVAAAERRDLARARSRGEVTRFGRSGRKTMEVDRVAFLNAVRLNGPDVVHDAEYWADMRRRHPHVDCAPDKTGFGLLTLRNRLGKVKWRRVYGDGWQTTVAR